jgi:hypothetical protein
MRREAKVRLGLGKRERVGDEKRQARRAKAKANGSARARARAETTKATGTERS